MTSQQLEAIVSAAISEDLPSGDLTTDSLDLGTKVIRAKLVAKEDLLLCGTPAVEETFKQIAKDVQLQWHFQEGQLVLARQTFCSLHGPALQVLHAERVALNFLGRMSGIASLTHIYVQKVQHTSCKILDTRKTTPAFRCIEKYAVKVGGGQNHRMNLSEAVLVKENHIAAVGDLAECIRRIRMHTRHPIEVEVSKLEELQVVLQENVDRVLLDNMSNQAMAEALEYIPENVQVEASGNMNLDRVASVAELGVDFISVGALTHSAPSADISLLLQT